jgi:hypothetical protein
VTHAGPVAWSAPATGPAWPERRDLTKYTEVPIGGMPSLDVTFAVHVPGTDESHDAAATNNVVVLVEAALSLAGAATFERTEQRT